MAITGGWLCGAVRYELNAPALFGGLCPNCGTGISSKGARPGVVMLTAGTLDDPEAFKPMAAVYASRASSWDQPPAGMPAFPHTSPTPRASRRKWGDVAARSRERDVRLALARRHHRHSVRRAPRGRRELSRRCPPARQRAGGGGVGGP